MSAKPEFEVIFGQKSAKRPGSLNGKDGEANDRWWVKFRGKPLIAGGGRLRTFETEEAATRAGEEEAAAWA